VSSTASPADIIKDEYLAQLRGVFPLSRALALLVCTLIAFTARDFQYKSVSESILNMRLASFASVADGLFGSVTVQDVVVGLILVLVGAALNLAIREALVARMKKQLRLADITAAMSRKSLETRGDSVQGYLSTKRAERESAKWAKKIASLSSGSQFAAALAVGFAFAAYFGNAIDAGVAVVCAGVVVALQVRSLLIFLRSYLPHAVHLRGQLGLDGDVRLP
jgi:hypothetical protein